MTYNGRNVVERCFALAIQWRVLATRYDKFAITHRAAVVMSARITRHDVAAGLAYGSIKVSSLRGVSTRIWVMFR